MKRWLSQTVRTVALVAAGFAVWAAPALADSWKASDDDVLILELRSGKYKLGESLRGYQTPGGVCVDFADLIQTLDLPIRLDKK